MRRPPAQQTVSARTAIVACVICSLLGGAAFAGASTLHFFAPGSRYLIVGYGYTCSSTTNRPSFSCSYHLLRQAIATPVMSIPLGKRTMTVRSELAPTVAGHHGTYVTTFKR